MANALAAYEALDHGQSYETAYAQADIRANHSFFDQHIIAQEDGSYTAIDEGDYDVLPQRLIDQVVNTIAGRMGDDDALMIGAVIDQRFDDIDPWEVPY